MVETVLQCSCLLTYHDDAYLWRTPLTEENVKRLAASRPRDNLIKCAKQHGNDEERDEATEYFKALYRSWELLSSGSHPSGTGLVQVMDQKGSGLRQIGALYGR